MLATGALRFGDAPPVPAVAPAPAPAQAPLAAAEGSAAGGAPTAGSWVRVDVSARPALPCPPRCACVRLLCGRSG